MPYVPTLPDYKKAKLKMLRNDFHIILHPADVAYLQSSTSEIDCDNRARSILEKYL